MSPPKRKTLLFSLSCGCRDSKSVAVSEEKTATARPQSSLKPETDLFSSTLASSWGEDKDESCFSVDTSPGFSGLLQQLNELEQSVLSWAPAKKTGGHVRSRSESGRVGESVAVVKDSDDPLSDFRRSMLQMIVEKEIVRAEELAELVRRFLALNSPQHHDVILRAFAQIWNQVFSRYQDAPDFLAKLRE
ncbi:transcription repressor OFP8-like [Aristolochia californica]|uniref:transcription repressor OFP8-like n=1 Tax=Aristolochia californica TaxID=171875 RepID=UPI0035D67813